LRSGSDTSNFESYPADEEINSERPDEASFAQIPVTDEEADREFANF
ncbi:hypothetical protein KIPB_012821, partial [Kipferlia bialata]